ncbi:hypothetical protein BGX23_002417, partial [Mortierella sp. AD031]
RRRFHLQDSVRYHHRDHNRQCSRRIGHLSRNPWFCGVFGRHSWRMDRKVQCQ